MDFESYLGRIPDLHSWDGGKTWNSGGFSPAHLRAFRDLALLCDSNNAVILETGAGNSTLAFLFASPAKLISIAPDGALFERIRRFCAEHGIDTSPLDVRVERSEWALPELARGGLCLDLALIDGGHGWPTVFVDFCYVNAMLRNGGILVIDDVNLHSIKELGRLLKKDETRFVLVKDMGKSLAFRKLTDERFLPEWTEQPYIAEQSERYARSSFPHELFYPGPARLRQVADRWKKAAFRLLGT
jgi:predicted O-methyltransferase YrrM